MKIYDGDKQYKPIDNNKQSDEISMIQKYKERARKFKNQARALKQDLVDEKNNSASLSERCDELKN